MFVCNLLATLLVYQTVTKSDRITVNKLFRKNMVVTSLR